MLSGALREALTWYYFIPRINSAGGLWFEELKANAIELCIELEHAVALARAKEIERSLAVLAGVAQQLKTMRERISPTLYLVLRRLYFAVLANVRYAQKEYTRATKLLERAASTETCAINQAAFLAILANSRCEFCLHHARIARNQYQWSEMAAWLEGGRAMLRNEKALVTLSCGRALFFRDIDAIYTSIPPKNADEKEALRRLTDAAGRQLEFETVARRIELLGTVVIPCE